jgi:Tfp pilus assembly protein PilV
MKNSSKKNNRNFGFMMIEVLVAVSIITASVLTAMAVAQKSIVLSQRSVHMTQAGFLLEEGAEAVRILRDNNWTNISNLSLNTDYYLSFNGSTWILNTTPSQIGKFTRKITFSGVYRDASGDIAEAGSLDSGTKLVTVTVTWNEGVNVVSKDLKFYILDIFSA